MKAEISDGIYSAEELSLQAGQRAWGPQVPVEEGRARDAARSRLIADVISQIREFETAFGRPGAAKVENDEIVAISALEESDAE